MTYTYFDRDLSWLAFNERVLMEAAHESVPLLERIRFLSIYSSNLDEFYRVRMPVIKRGGHSTPGGDIYQQAYKIINKQQDRFGLILEDTLIPALRKHNIHFCYKEGIPGHITSFTTTYFYTHIAAFLQPVLLTWDTSFFPENNALYLLAIIQHASEEERIYLINVPAGNLKRFVKIAVGNEEFMVFLEDIIKDNLRNLFPDSCSISAFNIKITRDADLGPMEEHGEDLAEQFEKQLSKRDSGFATRLLYEPGLPQHYLDRVISKLGLENASVVSGGMYHNLKDLSEIPVKIPALLYTSWPSIELVRGVNQESTLFKVISQEDLIIHAPYQSYNTILRFFNEASIDPSVLEIYTTLYRVAQDSMIVQALISAARNGKKVTVLVELKARFDEANNIRWAKKMKQAGVKIIHSTNALKVHAKIALVKRSDPDAPYLGLLATGNLNEGTARFYTDHILLTAYQPMLIEAEKLFGFLRKKEKPEKEESIIFQHLLVAQFNLQKKFIELIDREISHIKEGGEGKITIKLNNLEEEVLISKLYDASNAGVKINLIVRSICRLIPGVPGQSENIVVKRIVDRYLEHGRIFIFGNNGDPEVFMGSADWMNRNIYRRIEVCFPIYSMKIKEQLMHIIDLQWADNVQAVLVDNQLNNIEIPKSDPSIRSQELIYRYLNTEESTG